MHKTVSVYPSRKWAIFWLLMSLPLVYQSLGSLLAFFSIYLTGFHDRSNIETPLPTLLVFGLSSTIWFGAVIPYNISILRTTSPLLSMSSSGIFFPQFGIMLWRDIANISMSFGFVKIVAKDERITPIKFFIPFSVLSEWLSARELIRTYGYGRVSLSKNML